MLDRTLHLKIKLNNLVDEARLIRREENKALKRHRRKFGVPTAKERRSDTRNGQKPITLETDIVWILPPEHARCETYIGLMEHRKFHLSPIIRSHQLAYGFLRGRAYQDMERVVDDERRLPGGYIGGPPTFGDVEKISLRFWTGSEEAFQTAWDFWEENARRHLDGKEPLLAPEPVEAPAAVVPAVAQEAKPMEAPAVTAAKVRHVERTKEDAKPGSLFQKFVSMITG